MRWLIFVFLVSNLILVGISAMSFQSVHLGGEERRLLELSFGYSAMMAFALLFLSYWIWKDGEELDNLYDELDRLRRKIGQSM